MFKKNLFRLTSFAWSNRLYILGVLVLFGIFFVNTFHQSYPDEFDNILGGKYILEGKIIYKDFFTHHGPVAYFLAAGVLLFSDNSFVNFRIVYSIFLFALAIGGYAYLRYSVGHRSTMFYLPLLFLIGIASTYFWGHMLLADSLSAFLLLPVFTLVLLKSLLGKKFTLTDAAFVSILSISAFLSSLTYTYLVASLYLFFTYQYISSNSISLKKRKSYFTLLKLFGIFLAPVVLFAAYLLITQSFSDYFYQNFIFNQRYYIYNYPRPEGTLAVNPVRYMVVIGHSFFTNFTSLLSQIPSFNFSFPYNITLALANSTLLIYLAFKRKWALIILVAAILIFSNVRSNPLDSKETDYQAAVYMIFSLMAGVLTAKILYTRLRENADIFAQRLIFSVLFLLLSVYGLFTVFYLTRSFNGKVYAKYMGVEPRIYDRPQIAPFINDITQEGEYTWIGPFEFEELFYTQRPIASRYQIYNSAQGRAQHVGEEIIQDFEQTKPKVVWFDKTFFILGESPEQYAPEFINYLDSNYIRLIDYVGPQGTQYTADHPFEQRVDIETKLYIRGENAPEIVTRMLEKGYIKVKEE